jgi:hypothetical protein
MMRLGRRRAGDFVEGEEDESSELEKLAEEAQEEGEKEGD